MAVGSDKENGESEEEFTSDQELETSRGEDSIEFRKWKLEQDQEFRLKQMELENKARSEQRELELRQREIDRKVEMELEREKLP